MNKKKLIAVALSAALAVSSASIANAKVKCHGVAEKYKNDCAANGHSCAGQAKVDYDANEWKFVENDEECKMLQEKVSHMHEEDHDSDHHSE